MPGYKRKNCDRVQALHREARRVLVDLVECGPRSPHGIHRFRINTRSSDDDDDDFYVVETSDIVRFLMNVHAIEVARIPYNRYGGRSFNGRNREYSAIMSVEEFDKLFAPAGEWLEDNEACYHIKALRLAGGAKVDPKC